MKFYFLFFLTFLVFAQNNTVEESELEIELGIDKIEKLDFAYHTKVQIGNESILSLVLAPSKKEITFRGIKEGKTSVTIRDTVGEIRKKYIVNVSATGNSKVVSELKEFLGHIEGLDIGIKAGKVYVGGNIVVPDDIGLIVTILEKYPDVLRLMELSPQTQRTIAGKIKDELVRNGLKDVNIRIINRTFWLEGVVGSKSQKTFAENIVDQFIPNGVASLRQRAQETSGIANRKPWVSFISVNEKKEPAEAKKMIKITSQFVELQKDYFRLFSFQWQPLLGQDNSNISIGRSNDGSVTTNSSNTLSATISNLFPKLESAKNAGYARIVQSGVVVTQDQMAGHIEKSTNFQFNLGQGETARVVSAQVGFIMDITPKILEEEKVELSTAVNVSVNSNPGGAQPVETKNSVKTNLVVKSKESAIVGGIVQGEEKTDYDKNPPFGGGTVENGSPLFNLTKSKFFKNTKSQFVIFVTPEIIASASDGTEEIRKKFRRRRSR